MSCVQVKKICYGRELARQTKQAAVCFLLAATHDQLHWVVCSILCMSISTVLFYGIDLYKCLGIDSNMVVVCICMTVEASKSVCL